MDNYGGAYGEASEVDALIALDHPAIVRLIEPGAQPGSAESVTPSSLAPRYFVADAEASASKSRLRLPSQNLHMNLPFISQRCYW